MPASFNGEEMTLLNALAQSYSTADAALAEASALRAALGLPKGVIHVVSDVHGEYKKLRHIINNASGSLRPMVNRLFKDRLSDEAQQDLLAALYYPREYIELHREPLSDAAGRSDWVGRTLVWQF